MDRLSPFKLWGTAKAPAVASQSNDQALSSNEFSGRGRTSMVRGAELQLASVLTENAEDLLVLQSLATRIQLRFPTRSIENGTIRVGDVWVRATEELGPPEDVMLQLSYNGIRLEDHSVPCRNYKVKNKSVLECTWVRIQRERERGRAPRLTKGKGQSTLSTTEFVEASMPIRKGSLSSLPSSEDGLPNTSKGKQKVKTAPVEIELPRSANTTEHYFVKPTMMRPNSTFVGREAELAELHMMLMDKKRRSEGSSAVFLQCLPGGGKTHLARQYVYQHLDDYPGGVFFLRAKSVEELSAGFWDIAQTATLPFQGVDDHNPNYFIEAVRKWFERRHHWLLVLDGIHFNSSDFEQFIPDSTETSILYTSTEISFASFTFRNPQLLRLPLLTAKEAQELLLTELNIPERTQDDLRNSMELVQAMGFLPVVIHAVAQRLKASGEPLAKFAKAYSREPRLRGLGAYLAVVDELRSLDAVEALNLINIICFFGQQIPVELIYLGLASVDVPLKCFEPIIGKSFNNTLKILTKFALIDRNDRKYFLGDQSRSFDELEDVNERIYEIDTITMHGALQGFFIDCSRADRLTSIWLDRAAALFCQSFSVALQRINRTTNVGRVEDFQVYAIHGQQLQQHFHQTKKGQIPSKWKSTLQRSIDTISYEIEKRSSEEMGTSGFPNLGEFRLSVFDRSSSANTSRDLSPNLVQRVGDSDLESIASIEDDIFSTAGSFSSSSTVSSIRFTVIELIVGKFIEDNELSALYEEAIKRMSNERFVRNQRRLLKKFFLDLRPHAKTPIQKQAIRTLRGRAERTSIAEQIWSIVNPSNASRHAQMAALLAQKPDKQSQLDRLLGGDSADAEGGENEQDTLSEESEGSDSGGSGFANEETKYTNVDVATEFIVDGAPFKQYKLNLRGFLRMDPSRAKLQELVVAGDIVAVTTILSTRFEEVAQLEYDWLHELLDIGCSFEEMAMLLIDGEKASPWVLLNQVASITAQPSVGLHQTHCVHSGGQKVDTAPRLINANSPKTEAITTIDNSRIQEIISELCGIAGAIPLQSDGLGWMPSVRFNGDNSIAWIRYANDDSPATPTVCDPVLRMLHAMRRAYHAVGYLQEVGICCDTFTILVLQTEQPVHGNPSVELCNIDISLVESLYSSLQHWETHPTDVHNVDYLLDCGSIAKTIIRKISEDYIGNPDTSDLATSLNECALAVQILTVGILSYVQGHVGSLHPDFLVEPLSELHLLGNDTSYPIVHIAVNLIELTCVGDMLQKPVLVFRAANLADSNNLAFSGDVKKRYDLFASPEDIADTWSPARFLVDTASTGEFEPKDDSRNLWAIEVGGGTIAQTSPSSRNLHWSAGSASTFNGTFNSKKKILIGGVTVNDKCPLDEAESWRLPATNAYIRHLGTHQGGWELEQKQVGLQGGQYAVLQFNATYVKRSGVTLKQQQLMLPSNEIDLAFLNSACGLQVSFCTGVARRVALRELLADVMVDFVESKVSKPTHWEELKTTYCIVDNFRAGNLGQWFDGLKPEQRESAIRVVRSLLEVLKDTGIDKNDEELVIAWVRRESPYSCLRLRCEKTSLWARILADSEDCATFACITPSCLEIEKHKCRGLTVAPWHNVSVLLDTAVCPQRSNRELVSVVNMLAPFKLEHQVSYWIGKSGSNLIAKVWLTNDPEPRLVVQQKVIPEKYRSRLPKAMVERLGRLREQQVSNAVASQVVILADMPR
ncbi:hypothetical protein EG329_000213 [Mollisiaceae sp. DMI_Dod_QoI]|nr:hypothetical protein EG329_000213 [Helotiales sp. DMI_Dod_QoI]